VRFINFALRFDYYVVLYLLVLLSPLCRVFILISLRQTMSLHCCSYSVVTIHGAYIVSLSVETVVFYISTFRSMCAVPSMAVFRSFLTSCFPGMLLKYFLNLLLLLLLLLLGK
jgi:hypothetical protein